MPYKRHLRLLSLAVFTLVGLVALAGWPYQRADAIFLLPPRVSETPTPRPPKAKVGSIAVRLLPAPDKAWIGVQWGDPLGGWHDVETWWYEIDPGYNWTVRWVREEHFGLGPFRWVIYDRAGGKQWMVSESFYMPRSSGECVWVTVVAPTATATWIPWPTRTPTAGPSRTPGSTQVTATPTVTLSGTPVAARATPTATP